MKLGILMGYIWGIIRSFEGGYVMLEQSVGAPRNVPIGVSARHIHLSKEHLDVLFGSGYILKPLKPLSQPRQFAAEETVAIEGPKGGFAKVRILGPTRGRTQIEVSRTDSFTLGIDPPVRESGNIDRSPGLLVEGPKGQIKLEQGVIVAARHIHFHTSEAAAWGIRDKERLQVQLNGERPLVFTDVIARVSDEYALDLHIDTDEANAAGVKTGDQAVIRRFIFQ
jgi:putative phosphotransacetylase